MHSDDQEILLYLEDKLPSAKRERLEKHIGRCEPCAARFADFSRLPSILAEPLPRDLDEATQKKAVELLRPGRAPKGGSPAFRLFAPQYRLAFAGAAALLLIVSVYLFLPRETPVQFRSDRSGDVGSLVLIPEDGARVRSHDIEFRWTSLGESMAYKFSLLRETGAVVWSTDVRDTSLSLPEAIVLQPGKTYLWQIETSLADKTLGRSAVHAFTYSPD